MGERMHERDEVLQLLREFNIEHRARISRVVSEHGLYYGQPGILFQLMDHGRMPQRELTQRLRVSAATVTTSIKRLERAGLLQKQMDKDDMRRNYISLTAQGEEVARRCRQGFRAVNTDMLEELDDDECAVLGGLLERMIEKMRAADEH